MTDKCRFKEGDKVVYNGRVGIVKCLSIGWNPVLVRVIFDENKLFEAEWIDNRFLKFHNAPERVVFT